MAYRRHYNSHFGRLGAEVALRWPEKAVIAGKGKRHHTLGLALSGGGYRSAIFNYGILKGLHALGLLPHIDYLSAVSGGSWIGTPFSMTDDFHWFFHDIPDHANLIEEGFESLLANPARLAQEAALARKDPNYLSNIFGRLLAKTFLREHGQKGRYIPLSARGVVKDGDRPFLVANGTVNYRAPGGFSVTQECFEMSRLYCGSRSLGYVHAKDLMARVKPIRVRDAIAISGAAVAFHLPALGSEVAGFGLSREVQNYALAQGGRAAGVSNAAHLDVSDGGHYNNLGVESLIHRGCGCLIVVDAEHDPEAPDETRSNQSYSGLGTLLSRPHIPMPLSAGDIERLDGRDEPVHVFDGTEDRPHVLYVKLKASRAFDEAARAEPYNAPGFLENLFGRGEFTFDPQFSTAKLDYAFAEHRNLSRLGEFVVGEHAETFQDFAARSD